MKKEAGQNDQGEAEGEHSENLQLDRKRHMEPPTKPCGNDDEQNIGNSIRDDDKLISRYGAGASLRGDFRRHAFGGTSCGDEDAGDDGPYDDSCTTDVAHHPYCLHVPSKEALGKKNCGDFGEPKRDVKSYLAAVLELQKPQ